MTRDDILRELGWPQYIDVVSDLADRVVRVVRLAEAAEREACERLAWDTPDDEETGIRTAIALAIRERGEK